MADGSKIEWTDATWNVVTGCSRVSAGCENCYAERLAGTRLRHLPSREGLVDAHGRWNGKIRFNAEWLGQPLRWQRPRRIFVAAHGDLFHEGVSSRMIDLVFAVMALATRHRFQILTKRPRRMQDYIRTESDARIAGIIADWLDAGPHAPVPVSRQLRADRKSYWLRWPLPNVWLGVSAEDQATADSRIPVLLETAAAVRWLSAEPLLGPVEIDDLLWPAKGRPALDWVVAGGESGPRARPMDPSWPRSLRNQCICAETPFFFKQWGGRSAKSGGRELDGRTWDEMPADRRTAGG